MNYIIVCFILLLLLLHGGLSRLFGVRGDACIAVTVRLSGAANRYVYVVERTPHSQESDRQRVPDQGGNLYNEREREACTATSTPVPGIYDITQHQHR